MEEVWKKVENYPMQQRHPRIRRIMDTIGDIWNLLIENNHYYKSLDDKTKFQELKKLFQ